MKNGHNLRIYIGGSAVAKATTCQMNLSTDMIETAHKDTAGTGSGFKESQPGQKSGTMSTTALYAEADNDIDTIFDAWSSGTAQTLKFSDEVSTNRYWTATGYITSISKNAPDNEIVTYTVTWDLSGAITRGVNP